jgi:arsenate reductase-like glutaredoxin family protein
MTRPGRRSASSRSDAPRSTWSTCAASRSRQGELRRFVQRLGAAALLDTDGRIYREAGLSYLTMDEPGIVERLLADSRLLRLPLARYGEAVTAGPAEATWKAWITPDRADRPT